MNAPHCARGLGAVARPLPGLDEPPGLARRRLLSEAAGEASGEAAPGASGEARPGLTGPALTQKVAQIVWCLRNLKQNAEFADCLRI